MRKGSSCGGLCAQDVPKFKAVALEPGGEGPMSRGAIDRFWVLGEGESVLRSLVGWPCSSRWLRTHGICGRHKLDWMCYIHKRSHEVGRRWGECRSGERHGQSRGWISSKDTVNVWNSRVIKKKVTLKGESSEEQRKQCWNSIRCQRRRLDSPLWPFTLRQDVLLSLELPAGKASKAQQSSCRYAHHSVGPAGTVMPSYS